MKNIVFTIIVSLFLALAKSHAQTGEQLTVFDYMLGGAISVPECPCGKNGLYLSKDHAEIHGDCFERSVYSRKIIKQHLPVVNDRITIVFGASNLPAISMGDLTVTISDSKLIGAYFEFPSNDANNVFETLTKKYGENPLISKL